MRLLAAVPLVALSLAAPVVTATPAAAAPARAWRRPAVVRDATFHLRRSLTGGPADIVFRYGRPGDIPLMGDWNGDGIRTPGVVRVENDRFVWLLRNELNGGPADVTFVYARATTQECVDSPPQCVTIANTPVAADWDGNGTETPGVLEPFRAESDLYVRNSLSGGKAEHIYLTDNTGHWAFGDWDGNGTVTQAAVLGRQWEAWRALTDTRPYLTFEYGAADDLPVAGDWNRDGRSGPGMVRRLHDGHLQWLLRNAMSGGSADVTFDYGRVGDVPLVW